MRTIAFRLAQAAFLLVGVLSGCSLVGEDREESATGVFVSGTVVSAETGFPMRRVQVDLGEVGLFDGETLRYYLTDNEGRFSIKYKCKRGFYYVFIWGDASHWGDYVAGNSELSESWFECTGSQYDVVIELAPKTDD